MTNTPKVFAVLCAFWITVFSIGGAFSHHTATTTNNNYHIPYQQQQQIAPQSPLLIIEPAKPQEVDPELIDVQVPILKEHRQHNNSGVQCVWCSLTALCYHNGISEGYDLVKQYKHEAGPGQVRDALTARHINFKQVRNGQAAGIEFIKEYVTNKKYGVAIGIKGVHCINLVHYDEAKGIVKVIDNNGPYDRKIQTWTMDKFHSVFDSWVVVILPHGTITEHDDCVANWDGLYGWNKCGESDHP